MNTNQKDRRFVISLSTLALLLVPFAGHAAESDYYTEEQVYQSRPDPTHDTPFGCIGATGLMTRIYPGVTVKVEQTMPGSPAAGKFSKGEIITGINGVALQGLNPFVTLGNALTQAEASDGRMVFDVTSADGKAARKETVSIPVLGAYGKTWPLDCNKSKKIIEQAAGFYADPKKFNEGGIPGALACLFLLSTGDDKHLPRVQAYFDAFPKEVRQIGDHTWNNGYNGMHPREKRRFRDIQLPDQLKGWYAPDYDDSQWNQGGAPVGTGDFKQHGVSFPNKSDWGQGEFLAMRTTFDVEALDCDSYRLSILARQGFRVFLNGHEIHTYVWWKDMPHYRPIVLGAGELKHLSVVERPGVTRAVTEPGRQAQVESDRLRATASSDQLRKRPESRDRLDEPLLRQGVQELRDGLRRVLETSTLAFGCGDNHVGSQIEQARDELVGVLCFDSVRGQDFHGKVTQIERDDHVSPGSNGRGKHVPVIRIGQRDGLDQLLVAGNQTIPDSRVHERPRPLQSVRRDCGIVAQHVPQPLIVDLLRPVCSDKICLRQANQKISERRGIQNAGVVEGGDGEAHQYPIPSSWASAVRASAMRRRASSS